MEAAGWEVMKGISMENLRDSIMSHQMGPWCNGCQCFLTISKYIIK